jgi:hypothetical protein
MAIRPFCFSEIFDNRSVSSPAAAEIALELGLRLFEASLTFELHNMNFDRSSEAVAAGCGFRIDGGNVRHGGTP